jgi:hypothetical protein
MTREIELHHAGSCYLRHRELIEAAATLYRKIATAHVDADLLRMGANCMSIASSAAMQSNDARQTLRNWRECALAERQIRIATYRALRDGCINKHRYDLMFDAATKAARVREDERQRLRRQLLRMDLV